MEHAQRESNSKRPCKRHGTVLILILMEHAQRVENVKCRIETGGDLS